jgi:hypothetical protein
MLPYLKLYNDLYLNSSVTEVLEKVNPELFFNAEGLVELEEKVRKTEENVKSTLKIVEDGKKASFEVIKKSKLKEEEMELFLQKNEKIYQIEYQMHKNITSTSVTLLSDIKSYIDLIKSTKGKARFDGKKLSFQSDKDIERYNALIKKMLDDAKMYDNSIAAWEEYRLNRMSKLNEL